MIAVVSSAHQHRAVVSISEEDIRRLESGCIAELELAFESPMLVRFAHLPLEPSSSIEEVAGDAQQVVGLRAMDFARLREGLAAWFDVGTAAVLLSYSETDAQALEMLRAYAEQRGDEVIEL